MEKLLLNVLATDSAVTLWWEKPAKASRDQHYEVTHDDGEAIDVGCSHYTFDGLAPASAHTVSVRCTAGGEAMCAQAEIVTRAARRRVDVTQPPYCAVGDGQTLNTAALQRALDDASADTCVVFPAGVYMTGALRGHSHTEIWLDEGAVLQGTANVEDYLPRIRSRFEGTEMECYSSVLNFGELDHASGPNCEDILIHGHGTIASGGQTLALRVIESERERLKDFLAANAALVATCENDHTIPGRVRPRLINLSNCKDVRISGLTLQNGACWNVHMIYCDGIVTDHCTFRSEGVWNGDGWDPDSSENCTLFASQFYTGDDAVAIKSGKNPEGNVINKPTRHVRVFDCYSAFGHGIVIGSEMSGGVEDVAIWDCDLRISMSGFEIKATKKRGGYVRHVSVRDCVIPRVMMHSVLYNDDGIGAAVPPVLSDCLFERLQLTGMYQASHDGGDLRPCWPIELIGFDVPGHEARNITFRDVTMANGDMGVMMKYTKDVTLERITCQQEV
ncbi:MAG: glycoside hydrolase family 28 protein [Clostridia bacterium]|nr:glycoside hydrolase family 28 protein [Clostridia bacterium]